MYKNSLPPSSHDLIFQPQSTPMLGNHLYTAAQVQSDLGVWENPWPSLSRPNAHRHHPRRLLPTLRPRVHAAALLHSCSPHALLHRYQREILGTSIKALITLLKQSTATQNEIQNPDHGLPGRLSSCSTPPAPPDSLLLPSFNPSGNLFHLGTSLFPPLGPLCPQISPSLALTMPRSLPQKSPSQILKQLPSQPPSQSLSFSFF